MGLVLDIKIGLIWGGLSGGAFLSGDFEFCCWGDKLRDACALIDIRRKSKALPL